MRVKLSDDVVVEQDLYEENRDLVLSLADIIKSEIAEDDRFNILAFLFSDELGDYCIQLYTDRGTLFDPKIIIEDKGSAAKFLDAWFKLPTQDSGKEQFEGVFEGKTIKFNRTYGKYRFTDDECKQLLDGEKILIETETKGGDPAYFYGRLEEQEYQNFKYFGFAMIYFIPKVYMGYELNKGEAKALAEGKTIPANLTSKNGKMFTKNIKMAGKRIGWAD